VEDVVAAKTAAQQAVGEGPSARNEGKCGGSRRQKRREDGGDGGIAGFLYLRKAATGRQPRSGRAKPQKAAHRQRFYSRRDFLLQSEGRASPE
jgi:hypothetical protein